MIKIETPTMLQFYIFLRTFLLQYSRHPIYLTVMVRETESAEEKKTNSLDPLYSIYYLIYPNNSHGQMSKSVR